MDSLNAIICSTIYYKSRGQCCYHLDVSNSNVSKKNKKPGNKKKNEETTSSLLPFVIPIILLMDFDFLKLYEYKGMTKCELNDL